MKSARDQMARPPVLLHPMARWRSGHQLFFTSIQTLNMLLTMVRESIERQDWHKADRQLRHAAWFMGFSARSIEYASNYDWDQYHTHVRALMPPGFSGVMLADHEILIGLLRELRETLFSNPPAPLCESVAEFREAMRECYDAHNLICEAFVEKGPSLREMEVVQDNPQPATKVLDQFKRGRLKMLAPSKKSRR